jgi:hypothetical protein
MMDSNFTQTFTQKADLPGVIVSHTNFLCMPNNWTKLNSISETVMETANGVAVAFVARVDAAAAIYLEPKRI